MCSAEGDYITAKTREGTPVRIEWFDKGDTVKGYWTTIFKWEGKEVLSQIEGTGIDAKRREENDRTVLEAAGIDVASIEIHQPRFEA